MYSEKTKTRESSDYLPNEGIFKKKRSIDKFTTVIASERSKRRKEIGKGKSDNHRSNRNSDQRRRNDNTFNPWSTRESPNRVQHIQSRK